MIRILSWLLFLATVQAATQALPPPPINGRQQSSQFPLYTPTNFVRLMVVVRWDYVSMAPFLTAMVTTQGDEVVVGPIPNGDPPTAFNVTENGFRAQNGKYLFFDRAQGRVHLDDAPHNETQYMADGSIYSTDQTGNDYVSISACPGPRNVYTLRFGNPCSDYFVNIFPIPPQHLTGLWENHTLYPSPRQMGWMNWDAENVTVGDNSTIAPMLSLRSPQGAAKRLEFTWAYVLMALAMCFL